MLHIGKIRQLGRPNTVWIELGHPNQISSSEYGPRPIQIRPLDLDDNNNLNPIYFLINSLILI